MTRAVVVQVQGARYAFPTDVVLRVLSAVEVTALPNAGPNVMGVVDVGGEIVPVVEFRSLVGHPARPLDVNDVMVEVQSQGTKLLLPGDALLGISELEEASAPNGESSDDSCVDAFLADADGIVFGIDVDRVAAHADTASLERRPAVAGGGGAQ